MNFTHKNPRDYGKVDTSNSFVVNKVEGDARTPCMRIGRPRSRTFCPPYPVELRRAGACSPPQFFPVWPINAASTPTVWI